MEIKNYTEEYQRKTDDELLLIAACAHQLVPEANSALSGEMARRGLNQQTLEGRVMEWREQAHRSREERNERKVWSHLVWWAFSALMALGVILMDKCNGR
jgi:hypothetical protein